MRKSHNVLVRGATRSLFLLSRGQGIESLFCPDFSPRKYISTRFAISFTARVRETSQQKKKKVKQNMVGFIINIAYY